MCWEVLVDHSGHYSRGLPNMCRTLQVTFDLCRMAHSGICTTHQLSGNWWKGLGCSNGLVKFLLGITIFLLLSYSVRFLISTPTD